MSYGHFARIKVSTSTTGTGTITLGPPETGFVGFSSVIGSGTSNIEDGSLVTYLIEDGTAFELGRGTFNTNGSYGTLTRDVIESSNSDNLISLSGNATVSNTIISEDLRYLQKGKIDVSGDTITLDITTGNYFEYTLTGDTNIQLPAYSTALRSRLQFSGACFLLKVTGGGSVSTGYDIANAVYEGERVQRGFNNRVGFFKDDGTVFYQLGFGDDSLAQYNCSTAWSLNSASYVGKTLVGFSIPLWARFSPDGLHLYVSDNNLDDTTRIRVGDGVSASNAWDPYTYGLTTLTDYIDDSSVNTPTGAHFNNTGTQFLLTGVGGWARVYDTSQAYVFGNNGATCTLDTSVTFSGYPSNMFTSGFLKPDGTKFWCLDASNGGSAIYEFDLSTANDWGTVNTTNSASYSLTSIPNGGYSNFPTGTTCTDLYFSSDGTKMYLTWYGDGTYQYNVGTTRSGAITWSGGNWYFADGDVPAAPSSGKDTYYVIRCWDGLYKIAYAAAEDMA